MASITTRFNGSTRKPYTIQFDGVTISGESYKGTPAWPVLTLGSGLGADGGVGPADEVNRQIQFLANQTNPARDERDGKLILTVNGVINSVTILPKFRVFSPSGIVPPVELPFEISCSLLGSIYQRLDPPFSAITLDSTRQVPGPSISMDVTADGGQAAYLTEFREQYLSEEITFQFGFTILSVDYADTAALALKGTKGTKKSLKKKKGR